MNEATNYRVTMEAQGTDMFGKRKWIRQHVDVEAESASEAKEKAEAEHNGWRATWAERRKPQKARR